MFCLARDEMSWALFYFKTINLISQRSISHENNNNNNILKNGDGSFNIDLQIQFIFGLRNRHIRLDCF